MNKMENILTPNIDYNSDYFNSLKLARQRYRDKNKVESPAPRNHTNYQDK
jgi:hypothetical protein